MTRDITMVRQSLTTRLHRHRRRRDLQPWASALAHRSWALVPPHPLLLPILPWSPSDNILFNFRTKRGTTPTSQDIQFWVYDRVMKDRPTKD